MKSDFTTKPKRIVLKLGKGRVEWVGGSAFNKSAFNPSRRRYSEITPTNPFLYCSFRIIRFLFGEGNGRIPEWTRRWKCKWKATILIGRSRGETFVSMSREACVDWELSNYHKTSIFN